MSNSLFCNCCYPNPSGNPVDPDGHPSIFGGFSMACSISIKPLVSEAAYFYLQDFGLSKNHNQKYCNNYYCCSKLFAGDELVYIYPLLDFIHLLTFSSQLLY